MRKYAEVRMGAEAMYKTATILLVFLVSSTFESPAVRGDRPGSYPPSTVQPNRPTARPQHGSLGRARSHHRSSVFLHVGTPSYAAFGVGGYYPYSCYSYWEPYGIYYNPSLNYTQYYLPPTYIPAELLYGPQAVARFLGVQSAPAIVTSPTVRGAAVPAPTRPAVATDKGKSNAAAQERARRFLAFGDALFARQQFHQAGQRYRSAIEAAPDLPEAYYRQGFALLAVKQYRLAAKALRIAVELDAQMLLRDHLLATLYGDNHLVKNAHLEQLADAALDNPENGDLYFLVGAFLHANDEGERAVKFLRKALTLSPDAVFLRELLSAEPPKEVAAREFDT
jgi:tetratricopeptide (TPR) repeat protein